jgi:hypothetical protein
LSGIFDSHSWSNRVCESKRTGPDSVNTVEENVVAFSGHFVYTIDIHRIERVFFGYRKVFRLAIELSGTGKENLNCRVELSAGFKQAQLSPTINFQVRIQIVH